MNKNPFLNAALAAAYIIILVPAVHYGSRTLGAAADSLLAPIAMLSLFVLSAAIMGYLFIGTPLQLYMDGHKKPAVTFFFQTVGAFAGLTFAAFILLFFIR